MGVLVYFVLYFFEITLLLLLISLHILIDGTINNSIYNNNSCKLAMDLQISVANQKKRTTVKIWFHHFFFREEYDDKFNNNANITIDEDIDDIILVPNFGYSENCIVSKKEEQNIPRKNKFRFKHFKRHWKYNHHIYNSEELYKDILMNEKKRKDTMYKVDDGSTYDIEGFECSKRFKTNFKDLGLLFDNSMRNHNNFVDVSTTREIIPFQNLSYDDISKLSSKERKVSMASFSSDQSHELNNLQHDNRGLKRSSEVNQGIELKNEVNDSQLNESQNNSKRLCKEENIEDDKGKSETSIRDIYILYMENNEYEKSNHDNPKNDKDMVVSVPGKFVDEELDVKNNSTDSEVEMEETSSSSLSESTNSISSTDTTTSNTTTSTYTSGYSFSNSSNESDIPNIVYTIPTFRQETNNRTFNVSTILKRVSEGTLNENNLLQLFQNNGSGKAKLSFRSKKFYDKLNNEDKIGQKEAKEGLENPPNTKNDDELEKSIVKFDNCSYLLIYKKTETRKKPNTEHLSNTFPRLNQTSTSPKSILKTKENCREKEESKKAKECDSVDYRSFIGYLEHFENRRNNEEPELGKIREQQLNNYYSERFFPGILYKNMRQSNTDLKEYRRSKKATEQNIGRIINGTKDIQASFFG